MATRHLVDDNCGLQSIDPTNEYDYVASHLNSDTYACPHCNGGRPTNRDSEADGDSHSHHDGDAPADTNITAASNPDRHAHPSQHRDTHTDGNANARGGIRPVGRGPELRRLRELDGCSGVLYSGWRPGEGWAWPGS